MTTFFERFKILLKKYPEIRQQDIAKTTGIDKTSISKYWNGKAQPDSDNLFKLAKMFKVSPTWLRGQDVPMEESIATDILQTNIHPISTQKLPLLGDIACGSPIEASEEIRVYIESNSPITADFCLRCKGDSMIGARIYDGDIVFIRKQDIVDNGEIAAVIIDNEATLKRVQYLPEENILILKAENPKYADLVYTGEKLDHIRILGKAVSFYSEIK